MKNLSHILCTGITTFLAIVLYAPAVSGQNVTVESTGTQALASNTTGTDNTALGRRTLYNNTTGSDNTASGRNALFSNTTGSSNTASGRNALYYNITGQYNTANGRNALFHNTDGWWNTANGAYTLNFNTTGEYNTANGAYALYSNTTGEYNTANGMYTLNSNTTGNYNTANGYIALYSNTTGSNNTASGMYALTSNTDGSGNTANGLWALYSNGTGNYNTGLGCDADVSTGSLTNATVIGYGATVDASNKVRIGNTAVTSIGGEVGWTTFSDGRYKEGIKENVTGLAFINSLRPVTYTVNVARLNEYFNKDRKQPRIKDEKINAIQAAEDNKATNNEDNRAIAAMAKAAEAASKIVYNGFIAQEVEEAANKLGIPFSGVDKPQSKDGLYGLRYDNFVVPLVKAVQELSKMNEELQKQQKDLQKQFDELKALVLAKGQGSSSTTSVVLSDASLEQNAPNPFDKTTAVGYTLPQSYATAQIVISDQSGRLLKQINVSGIGKGTLKIDTGTLAAGTYNYSLVVDGKIVDTKRMALTR